MFEKTVPIRAICKWHVQNLGIFHCLLHSAAEGLIIVFGFNNCNWVILRNTEQIVVFLTLFAGMLFTLYDNTAIREVFLHGNIFK